MTTGEVKPKVLFVGPISRIPKPTLEKYSEIFEFIDYKPITREQTIEDFKTKLNDIEGIFPIWQGFTSVGGLDGDLLDAVPKSVKVVVIGSAGYDRYNVASLNKKGIILCNASGMSANEVADIALHLALSSYRYTSLFEYTLRKQGNTRTAHKAALEFDIESGRPLEEINEPVNYDIGGTLIGNYETTTPFGQIVGIAGFGGIGQALARRLHALGMEIHYLKRNKLTEEEENSGFLTGIPLTYHDSFESLVKVSDLLALILPLSDETYHILNDKTIDLLPNRAKVINVGRGKLIDEEALLRGLKSGKIGSAGLDVFEGEPDVHPELLKRLDVTVLPHIGGRTISSGTRAIENCFKNLHNVIIEGGKGLTPVRD